MTERYNHDRVVTLNCGLGRDSLTMLGLLFEGYLEVDGQWLTPWDIDAVVFSDTGAEWPHTYGLIEDVADRCRQHGVRFFVLNKPPREVWSSWLDACSKAREQGVELPRREWLSAETIEEKAACGDYHLRAPILEDFQSRSTVVSLGKGDCTDNHKIQPIRKFVGDLCEERFGVGVRKWGHLVRQGKRRPHVTLIGIAADEASRADPSKSKSPSYITERFPLLEMGIAKSDEAEVLEAHGWQHVVKSGCWLCPYQSAGWFWAVRETLPGTWEKLLRYEEASLERNPKMFVMGRKPLVEMVEAWRAKNPGATPKRVFDKSYVRGCAGA